MRQPEDLQRNDKMIKRYDKFCEEVKDITTTLCLTCLNITFKDRSTQARKDVHRWSSTTPETQTM